MRICAIANKAKTTVVTSKAFVQRDSVLECSTKASVSPYVKAMNLSVSCVHLPVRVSFSRYSYIALDFLANLLTSFFSRSVNSNVSCSFIDIDNFPKENLLCVHHIFIICGKHKGHYLKAHTTSKVLPIDRYLSSTLGDPNPSLRSPRHCRYCRGQPALSRRIPATGPRSTAGITELGVRLGRILARRHPPRKSLCQLRTGDSPSPLQRHRRIRTTPRPLGEGRLVPSLPGRGFSG